MTKVKYGFPKILFIAVLAVLSACNPQKPSSDFSLAFGSVFRLWQARASLRALMI